VNPWQRFAAVARGGQADRVPVALIVDSPWLPGYAGIDTLDFFLDQHRWFDIHHGLLARFPEVAWIPGYWVEYGMGAEPSAFGARLAWHHDQPPAIEPLPGGLGQLLNSPAPDPQVHGLMPFILQQYAATERRLLAEGAHVPMVAARGPLTVSGWLLGMSDLMVALMEDPAVVDELLDRVATLIIAWLKAQLAVLARPEGIMLLDDLVGMISPTLFDRFVVPVFSRIFAEFPGLIKVYHNDTPCPHLLGSFERLGFDVFNFSHVTDISLVAGRMPNTALMGNVAPLDLMVYGTPDQVFAAALECLRKTGGRRLILSAGGGASPGMPAEALDALVAARDAFEALPAGEEPNVNR
jgi:uroporphyrinogen decarboxylase